MSSLSELPHFLDYLSSSGLGNAVTWLLYTIFLGIAIPVTVLLIGNALRFRRSKSGPAHYLRLIFLLAVLSQWMMGAWLQYDWLVKSWKDFRSHSEWTASASWLAEVHTEKNHLDAVADRVRSGPKMRISLSDRGGTRSPDNRGIPPIDAESYRAFNHFEALIESPKRTLLPDPVREQIEGASESFRHLRSFEYQVWMEAGDRESSEHRHERALDFYRRAWSIDRKAGSTPLERMIDCSTELGRWREATESLTELVMHLKAQRAPDAEVAKVLHRRGMFMFQTSSFSSDVAFALNDLNTSIAILSRRPPLGEQGALPDELARCLIDRARIHIFHRDLKQALADVQRAVDLTSDSGGRPEPERQPLHFLCVGARGVVLSFLGKATASADLDHAIAALVQSRDAAGFGNYYVLFLAVRGMCFLKANNLPEAERYYGWAISSTDTKSSSFRDDWTWKNILGECHEQRAELMRRRGQFRQAMEEYDKAIALADDLLASHGWWEFSGLCRRANARFDARDYKICIRDFNKCIYFHCNLYETTRKSSDLGQILECLLRRGVACSESGESASAIKDFERGISLIEQAGKESEWRLRLFAFLNNFAFALGRSKDGAGMRRGIALATRACELTDWKEPEALDTLAEVHAHTGDFELAMKYQEMAMAALKPSDEERRARYAKKIEDFRAKARAKSDP